jgi:ferrochelatase
LKLAVVLFNLGGPDSLDAVEPFLRNLFSDPAILSLPIWLRLPAARLLARRRTPVAQDIYRQIGGRSPLLEQTEAQARAIEEALRARGMDAQAFVAMRAWKPRSEEAARAVLRFAPDLVVLLPLYPQFSTTTSGSSLAAWAEAAASVGLVAPHRRVCCYPWSAGFVGALSKEVRSTLARCREGVAYRILFSAHGLPQRVVAAGDPYQWQVEQTVGALIRELGIAGLDWRIAYQSRVGPLKWLQPATDDEIRKAGAERKGVIVVPVVFVSEHSETLVELDIDYARLAREAGVVDYLRTPTVGTNPGFIEGLAELVQRAAATDTPVTCGEGRICPGRFVRCGMGEAGQ